MFLRKNYETRALVCCTNSILLYMDDVYACKKEKGCYQKLQEVA